MKAPQKTMEETIYDMVVASLDPSRNYSEKQVKKLVAEKLNEIASVNIVDKVVKNHVSVSTEDARKLMESLVNRGVSLIRDAEVIAEEHGLSFSVKIAYGMGGSFGPDWNASDDEEADYCWSASSHQC